MAERECSPADLEARVAALETSIVSIRDLMNERDLRYTERAAAQDKAVALSLASSKEAVLKAEVATERRFEGVNEFRAALSDQSATLLPRTEYSVQHQNLVDKNIAVDKRISELQADILRMTERSGGKREGIGLVGTIVLGSITTVSALAAIGIFMVALLRH